MAIFGYTAAILLLVLDRWLKWYAQHSLPAEGVFWIPRYLGLERYENHGLAFSLPFSRTAIILATIAILFTICRSIWKHDRSVQTQVALAFLILGALSNFYDRLFIGYVVDYLRIGPLSLVNVADGMIVVGLLLVLFKKREPLPHTEHSH